MLPQDLFPVFRGGADITAHTDLRRILRKQPPFGGPGKDQDVRCLFFPLSLWTEIQDHRHPDQCAGHRLSNPLPLDQRSSFSAQKGSPLAHIIHACGALYKIRPGRDFPDLSQLFRCVDGERDPVLFRQCEQGWFLLFQVNACQRLHLSHHKPMLCKRAPKPGLQKFL